jgi:hypothetical protein
MRSEKLYFRTGLKMIRAHQNKNPILLNRINGVVTIIFETIRSPERYKR